MYVDIQYDEDGNITENTVRIHDTDVWNLDHTLAHVIYPALLLLKDSKNGSPHVANEDVPEALGAPVGFCPDEGDEHWHERWAYVLDEMIWAFKAIVEGEGYSFRMENGCRLFGKYYQALWT